MAPAVPVVSGGVTVVEKAGVPSLGEGTALTTHGPVKLQISR